jgi:hypothetical protein
MVALLAAALGGGAGPDLESAARLLAALAGFVALYPAAAAAARAAGALPLATRAVVAAHRAPGPDAGGVLCEGFWCMASLAVPGDLPALAARPDLVAALAGAVALAADSASGGSSAFDAQLLGKCASLCVAQLLAGGQGSIDAAAEGFLAAGGAAPPVGPRARASVLAGRARRAGGLQRGLRTCGIALWVGHRHG